MALMGLPTGTAGGDIKPRIQYDAKAGRWHRVDRHQNAAGEWVQDMVDMDKGAYFLMDLANIEVGWIAFASTGPDFQMVPNGTPVGPRPSEAHKPGFRVNVALPGEAHDRTFASTAKAVIAVVDELHTEAAKQPGMVPIVKITGTRVVETKGPAGTTRNYAPLLEIVKFVSRPPQLGGGDPVAKQPDPAPAPERALVDDEVPF